MSQYYVATEGGNTEGPFSRYDLLMKYARGEVNGESLVCAENGQEWVQYRELFASKAQKMNTFDESKKQGENYSSDGISGAFRGVGIVCFVLAVLVPLLLLIGGSGQTIFAAAIFLVLALSGLGWIGIAHIISLLERIAENTRK